MAVPDPELPVYPRKKPPVIPPKVPKRIKILKQWRDDTAKVLGIDPALVCTKSLMNTIAIKLPRNEKDMESIEELKLWQRQAFGEEIVGILKKVK
jgi:ribonuclease D